MALDKGRLTPSQTFTRAQARGANIRIINSEPGFAETVYENGTFVTRSTQPEREGQLIAVQDTSFKKFRLFVCVRVDLPTGGTQLQWKQVKLYTKVLDGRTGLPWDPLTAS